jgi:integrase
MGGESTKTKRVGNGVSVYEGKRKKAIRINFTFKGVLCRETLSLQPTPKNIKFATNYLGRIHDEIARENFDYAAHFPNSKRAILFVGSKGTVKTIGEALDLHLAGIKRTIQASTYRDYKSVIEYHLKPAFGNIFLKDLTSARIKAWIADLPVSNKRVNNVLIPLRQMYENAYEEGFVHVNPLIRVKHLSVEIDEPDPFELSEIITILDALPEQGRNLFQFAFWSGLRTGELIALEWGDMDWEKGVIVVRRNSVRKVVKGPKSKAGNREVLILPPAMEALQAQKPFSFLMDGAVFHNPKTMQPWETDAQIRRTCWQHALKKSGVRYRTPYQTRHTYASMLLTAGEDPTWIAKQMGHKDWGVIRTRYARWIPGQNPTAGRKAANLFKTISKVTAKHS